MSLHSKGHQAVGLTAIVCVTCLTGVAQTAASSDSKRNPPLVHGPALRTEKGNYSFRGLHVPIGQTSPAIEIPINNGGDVPLSGISAAIHGDFVVTGSSCLGPLPVVSNDKSQCAISVAFRPTAAGLRTGDLTIRAAGVKPQVVPLVAGAPIIFPTVEPGATSVQWVELPAGTGAVSGSVTGPFAIALQASYAYGSIDGVQFASSAVTDGVCGAGTTPCGIYLGVKLSAGAPAGQSLGVVTLSNGLTYALAATVSGNPDLLISPASIDEGSVPLESTSDTNSITITNVLSVPVTLGSPTVTDPFALSSTCGSSLAAGATCTLTTSFSPTATGLATGMVELQTSLGNYAVALAGTGVSNPANVQFTPATLTLTSDGAFGTPRTITITNLSTVNSVQSDGGYPVFPLAFCGFTNGSCLQITDGLNCSGIAPGASCQIQVAYFGPSGSIPFSGSMNITMTVSGQSTGSIYSIPFTAVGPPQTPVTPQILAVSPQVLQFPTTPFGQSSAGQTVTVTNISQLTLAVNAYSGGGADIVSDPSCGPLVPGQSCQLSFHYVPTAGVNADVQLGIFGVDLDNPPVQYPPLLGNGGVNATGASTSNAFLGSPAYPPLVQPVDLNPLGGLTITNPSTAPLVLSAFGVNSGVTAFLDATECGAAIPPGGSCTVFQRNPACATTSCPLAIYSSASSSPDVYQVVGGQQFADPNTFLGFNGGPFVFPQTVVGSSASSSIPIAFANPNVAVNGSILVSANVSSDFVVDNQCPASLVSQLAQPNLLIPSCIINLTFAPKSIGFHYGTVTINTSLGLWTELLAGTGVPAPVLQITPSSLVVGAQVGQTGVNTLTLKNTSGAALALSTPALAGPQKTSFSISQSTCGSTLAGGASCTIQIAFANPGTPSLSSALLLLTSGNNVVQTITLTGVVPQLIVTPNAGAFASTSIGNHTDILFTLTSLQGAPITLQAFALNGTNPTDFKIASSTCTAGLVLQGTMSCVIDVAFAPHDLGSLSATLEIDNTAAVYNANLAGTGAPGPAKVSPVMLTFGNENLHVPSASQLITLSNPNPAPLTLPALAAISGANPADFSVTGTCATIPANNSCQLSVLFDPSATGNRTASLVIGTGTAVDPTTGQPVSTSTTVYFTGVGVATGPGAIVRPLNVHFRRREVGSVSREEKIFLRNPGTTTLTLAAPPAITGADPLDFRLNGICSSIAAGGHCELEVQFAPTAEGRRSATLSIPTGGRANGSAQVSLTGTGCLADDEERHERAEEGCERRHDEGRRDDDHDH